MFQQLKQFPLFHPVSTLFTLRKHPETPMLEQLKQLKQGV